MRGNKAPLPSARSHQPRARNRNGNSVRLEAPTDGSHFEVDLDQFGMEPELTSDLAAIFAQKMSRRGSWRTIRTCAGNAWVVQRLAQILLKNGTSLPRLSAFTPALFTSFERATSSSTALRLKALLRLRQGYSREMQAILDTRTRKKKVTHEDISHEEARRLRNRLDSVLRTCLRRMTPYLDVMDSDLDPAVQNRDVEDAKRRYLVSLIRHGGVRANVIAEYESYVSACKHAKQTPQGGFRLQQLVFLRKWEADALILRFVLEYGWNLTTVLELEVPSEQRNPVLPTDGTYSVKLVKRRRFTEAVEYRTLPIIDRRRSSDLFTLALTLTKAARRGAADENTATRLILHGALETKRGISVVNHVGVIGLASRLDISANSLSPKRMRKYVNTMDRRSPNQNTQSTHEAGYVATSLPAKKESLDVSDAGLNDALRSADDFYKKMLRPDETMSDTVGSGCTDTTHGPFTRAGSLCQASFLDCFSCPNARVAPRHHPVVTVVHDSLVARQSLPDYVMRKE